MSEGRESSYELAAVIFGALMLGLYLKFKTHIERAAIYYNNINWQYVIYTTYYIIFIIIVLSIVVVISYKRVKYYNNLKQEEWSRIQAIQDHKRSKIEYFDKLMKDDFCEGEYYLHIDEIEKKLEHANEYFEKNLPKEKIKTYRKKLEDYNHRANNTIKIIEKWKKYKDDKKLEEERKEQEKIDLKNKQVKELLEFKKLKNSIEALPLKHNYTSDIIGMAERDMESYKRHKEYLSELRREAIEYYKYTDIETKPHLTNKEYEEVYDKVREDIKSGKIKLRKEPEIIGEKLKEKFYLAKGLSNDIKIKALSQGFKHVRGVDLDGKVVPGGFYIKKETSKESDSHFYKKHLLKEIDDRIRIEYCIEDKRADGAIITEYMKIGIEIETGTNDNEQLAEKIEWLNHHFNMWIFIVPREHYDRYSLYVDNKQSYCYTSKRAKEWIIEMLASIDQQ